MTALNKKIITLLLLLLPTVFVQGQKSDAILFTFINAYTNAPEPELLLTVKFRENMAVREMTTDRNGRISIPVKDLANACLFVEVNNGKFQTLTLCFGKKPTQGDEAVHLHPSDKYEKEITILEDSLAKTYFALPQKDQPERLDTETTEGENKIGYQAIENFESNISYDGKNLDSLEIYDKVDLDSQFPGGKLAMQNFIMKNVQYPQVAIENGIQGKVYISFIVERNGKISHTRIMRGVSLDLDNEAKRLIRSMPNWTPGTVKGLPVRSRVHLPINFTLV